MDRVVRFGLAVMLGVSLIAGCGKDSAPDATATNSTASVVVQNAADPATNPIAAVASVFVDAVIKGDLQRAEAQLTPLALQRIDEGEKEFKPTGLDNATFRIGEVRTPSETQAIVQSVLNLPTSDGKSKEEELCCLMRLVDNEWRVSGIAFTNEAGRLTIVDFENPPRPTQTAPMAATPGQSGYGGAPAVGRPSPQRSAQETPAPTYR